MKIQILNKEGKKVKEMSTGLFEEPIREDIISKVVEAERIAQPFRTTYRAGMDRSASGLPSKRRHVWKSDRGKGLARLPKKIMSRRGTQFNWEAAIVPSTRGGRRAHPPKGSVHIKKINKKEQIQSLLSSLTYISSPINLQEKYDSLKNKDIEKQLPLIVNSDVLNMKTNEFTQSLKNILGNLFDVAIQKKATRAGKGKMRGRKYKKNAGLLVVIGKNQTIKQSNIDAIQSTKLQTSDLASNGARLTLFTETAINELEERLMKHKEKKHETDND